MGMFDSFYDAHGNEWQTKAFDCNLDEFEVGDAIPADTVATYQVEVSGSRGQYPNRTHIDSFVTVRDGVVAVINDVRLPSLPLLNYSGHLVRAEGL